MSDVMISNLPISANQHFFCQLVDDALAEAKKLGATDAVAQVSENRGLSVSVRKQKTENVEQARERSLSITVFDGQKRGAASTADLDRKSTRLNSSHVASSYAVFCLKKKTTPLHTR